MGRHVADTIDRLGPRLAPLRATLWIAADALRPGLKVLNAPALLFPITVITVRSGLRRRQRAAVALRGHRVINLITNGIRPIKKMSMSESRQPSADLRAA